MTSPSTAEVLRRLDALQPHAFVELLAEDASMTFGNAEPLVGRNAIADGLAGFATSVVSFRHTLTNEWIVGADTIVECTVEYERLDRRLVTIPVAIIWSTTREGLIDRYRIFFDAAPVFA